MTGYSNNAYNVHLGDVNVASEKKICYLSFARAIKYRGNKI